MKKQSFMAAVDGKYSATYGTYAATTPHPQLLTRSMDRTRTPSATSRKKQPRHRQLAPIQTAPTVTTTAFATTDMSENH
jgi:hypothetical protein